MTRPFRILILGADAQAPLLARALSERPAPVPRRTDAIEAPQPRIEDAAPRNRHERRKAAKANRRRAPAPLDRCAVPCQE